MRNALGFTDDQIIKYNQDILDKIGSRHKDAIIQKSMKLHEKLDNAIDFLKKYPNANHVTIDELTLTEITNTLRSSLEIYREDISQIDQKYDIENLRKEKEEIQEILKTNLLKNAKSDLFSKYYKKSMEENAKLEFFISYSSKDKKLAGKIRSIIKSNSIEAFLAHRDIPLSKEWRNEILSKLGSCSHLIAVCTENYKCSAWGNQEVGIALEKGKNIIPIFAEGTDKTRFGFLETKQGYPKEFTEENIEQIIEKILLTIL